jgi:AcrR family transcriptional regulator
VNDPSIPLPSPRRGRPRTITDAQILMGARRAVLARGPHVTTRELARFAGVSEGTLFRRYTDKFSLVRKALGLDAERLVEPFESLAMLTSPSPQVALEGLVERVLQARAILDPFSDARRAAAGDIERRCVDALTRYLRALGSEQRTRVDAELAAKTLVAILLHLPSEEEVRTAVGVVTSILFVTPRLR